MNETFLKKTASDRAKLSLYTRRLQQKWKQSHFPHLFCRSHYHMYWQKQYICVLWISTHWHKLVLFRWTVSSCNQGCNNMCCFAEPTGNHPSKFCWVEKRGGKDQTGNKYFESYQNHSVFQWWYTCVKLLFICKPRLRIFPSHLSVLCGYFTSLMTK